MTPPDTGTIKIGPLGVALPGDVVEAYCAVIGVSSRQIPLSIVTRVYALPEFLRAMKRRYPGKLSVHIHHRVEAFSELKADRDYAVTFTVTEAARETVTIDATLTEIGDAVAAVKLTGKFALIDATDAGAA